MNKNYHSILGGVFLLLFTFTARAQKPPKLSYMHQSSYERAFDYAISQKKPVLILVHSNSCYSSRKFVREVVVKPSIEQLFRSKFVCISADIATKEGRKFAQKHGILMLPAIFMFSTDKEIKYQCKLSLDTNEMKSQVENFMRCLNIREQIELFAATNNVSMREASQAISQYYSKKDKKKGEGESAGNEVFQYTLGISWFDDFRKGYVSQWSQAVNSPAKKQ